MTSRVAYEPYGAVRDGTPIPGELGFTGQRHDPESGVYQLRARSYDPATGQFLPRDPLAMTTGEPYGYAFSSPTVNIDPTGLIGIRIGKLQVGDGCPLGKNPNGSCRGSNVDNVLHAVNTASSVVSGAAGLCTAAGAASVIGAPVAGACASVGAAAFGVNAGTGAYLVRSGQKSVGSYTVDLALAATGGAARHVAKAGGRYASANARTGGLLGFLGVPTAREIGGTLGHSFGWSASVVADATSLARSFPGKY